LGVAEVETDAGDLEIVVICDANKLEHELKGKVVETHLALVLYGFRESRVVSVIELDVPFGQYRYPIIQFAYVVLV